MSLFEKKIIGIDFHDYAAHLVEIKMVKNDFFLEAYNRTLIPPNIIQNGKIVKVKELKIIIESLLKTTNPKAIDSREVAIILPPTEIFSHIFALPINLNDSEVQKSLSFEAENIIPFSINDVYWDYSILEKDLRANKNKFQYVLFSAIKKEIADEYLQLLESMDLNPSLFGTHAESLQYGVYKQSELNKNYLIIDVDTISTNYLIIRNNVIKYFFSSNKGGRDLVKNLADEFQSNEVQILEQKEKGQFEPKYLDIIKAFMISNYSLAKKIVIENEAQQNIGKIDEIFLTGEFINLPNFYELAQENFKGKKVNIGDPRKYLLIDAKKFKPLNEKNNSIPYSTYFINSVGIAVRALLKKEEVGINLLPERAKKRFSDKKYSIFVFSAAILMCLVSLSLGTLFFLKHQTLTYQRVKLEVQKSAVEKIIYGTRYQQIREEIDKFNKEVAELNTINNSLFSVPTVIDELTSLMPSSTSISILSFDDSNLSITIDGVADDRESLLEMTNNFKKSDLVSEVITPISTFDEKFKISFSIQLKLVFKNLPKYGEAPNL